MNVMWEVIRGARYGCHVFTNVAGFVTRVISWFEAYFVDIRVYQVVTDISWSLVSCDSLAFEKGCGLL